MRIDNQHAQMVLKKANLYDGAIDGIIGSKTKQACETILSKYDIKIKPNASRLVAAVQTIMSHADINVIVDGFFGPATEAAIEEFLGFDAWRDDDQDKRRRGTHFPYYAGIRDYYGEVGQHQTHVKPTYDMVLAWDTSVKVTRISVHEKIADQVQSALQEVADNLGHDKIKDLGLDKFGGSLNVRKMRGGTKYSTHSWGIAIDFDPARNRLREHKPQARLSHADAIPFWEIWEKRGFESLGREKNYDWMHVQAVSIK